MLEKIKGNLVVSCQALDNEPLHSSYIMSRMAVAAQEGGASGIRANSVVDIKAIKKEVDLPVIGIIKRDYPDSEVFITATKKEIDELATSGCEMIALDATSRKRPHNEELADVVKYAKEKYPNTLLMGDVALVEEAKYAAEIGFDCVSSTLIGYTKESSHLDVSADDFAILKEMIAVVSVPLIAEGNINTPEKLARVLELGVHSAVVGSSITRPQLITKTFVDAIK
ncbi:N-acetylmannosamine-6-phosphate 2-epimerase [Vagococcus intermedius]|uniref:Putative N-acetylmannosamine-6-phosphate 2-epimerase n=1 Tax=Vagococcus intermedius TaxID=2991418 RepID=A0AAF0I8I1_9ENTE|nr:N-acetylmannosamine-6-phosphate 2-epimerase [Vagococcus intermedius]WEG73981.1 N-acetylmannosamine-6-phosphate 2-epimerase [Vagococcus intermedius]WEG76061.1 N-acetylmannosamine-6-phosphate 2-epimerase [Vagococcus intermedius]